MSGRRNRTARGAPAVAVALFLAACTGGGTDYRTASSASAAPTPSTTGAAPVPPGSVVVAAAGDISCEPGQPATEVVCQMAATADLVEAARPDVVLTLGDNQYEDGTIEQFRRSYAATWGRFKDKTRPSVGNHEYNVASAAGYFDYFGAVAGTRGEGWYSFDAGSWHLIAINSNCSRVGGCGPGTPQYEWLRSDLAASGTRCTLAYWHHPRFTSGYHGNDESVAPLWDLLAGAGAELVLSGHDHHYERLAPLAPDGTPDPGGMRQMIAGTGGRSLYPALASHAGSEVRRATSYGILVLTLEPSAYRWDFMSIHGGSSIDSGRSECRE